MPRSSDPRSDSALLEAAQHGDAAAFDVLYARYRRLVAAWAERYTNNADDALEVFQQAFQWIIEKLPTLKLTGRFSSLLYPIVRNLACDLHHRNGRRAAAEHAACASPQYLDDETLARREALAAVVASLTEGQRSVVLMRFVDGLSLDEISDALGVPPGTVKSRLHYALETLRRSPRCESYLTEALRTRGR